MDPRHPRHPSDDLRNHLAEPADQPTGRPTDGPTTTVVAPWDEQPYHAFRRAEAAFEAGQPAVAADLLVPVLAAEPENVTALELLARCYFGSAQLSRAETTLRRLVELAPTDAWARFALARALERRAQFAEAATHRRIAAALGLTG